MGNFHLSRRAVLRGAGGIAIALPWLEIMGDARTARAAGAPAQRFVGVYTPGGTVANTDNNNGPSGQNRWRPTGSEDAPILSPILSPLEAQKSHLLVIDGLEMKSAVGEQHQAGIVALFTGTEQVNNNGTLGYARGPSIDQVIASRISAGKKPIPSLQLAVRWGTGKSKGNMDPRNALSFENSTKPSPVPPRLDPQQVFKDLFGSIGNEVQAAAKNARQKSILDFLDGRYAGLSQRLGASDKQKVEQHLTKIRELEQSLAAMGNAETAACAVPKAVDTSDYNPRTALNADDNGQVMDISTDAAIPKVGKFMMDMLVMALACERTCVATLQWSDTEAKHTFPWLGLSEHHHYYQHDGGFKPDECQKICTWYSSQHAYLLQAMAQVDMGGHSLLDESVVFIGSELSHPPTHQKTNLPLLLAGHGGGLRPGRWLRYNGLSHNNLLVSLLNLFGDDRQTFGDAKHCTGPLSNLL